MRQIDSNRRRLLVRGTAWAAATVCGGPIALPAWAADDYPSRYLKAIVPYPAGGLADVSSRAIFERLSKDLGQPVVVENRLGAASTVASNYFVSQPADGYSLYMAPLSMVLNPIIQGNTKYDARRDFAPISLAYQMPLALICAKSLGVTNVSDLVALIRKHPGKYAVGTSGQGAINHLAAEYFARSLNLTLVVAHYKGGSPALTDLMGGFIQIMFSAIGEAEPFIRSDKVQGLAVTSLQRVPLLKELPTIEESLGLKGFEAVFWSALMVPAKTPAAIQNRLREATRRIGTDKDLAAALARTGVQLKVSSPQDVLVAMDRDEAKWGKIIRELGIKE